MRKSLTVLAGCKLAIVGLSLIITPILSLAQGAAPDADRLAAAKELMVVTGSARQFDAFMPLMLKQLEVTFTRMRPDQEATIKEVFHLMTDRFISRKQELIDEIAVVYASRFTLEELNGVAAFYKSPLGLKFVEAQPELMKQGMAIGQAWGLKIGQEIDGEVRKELKNRGIPL